MAAYIGVPVISGVSTITGILARHGIRAAGRHALRHISRHGGRRAVQAVSGRLFGFVPSSRTLAGYLPGRRPLAKSIVGSVVGGAVWEGRHALRRVLHPGHDDMAELPPVSSIGTPPRSVRQNGLAMVPYSPPVTRISPPSSKRLKRSTDSRLNSLLHAALHTKSATKSKWPGKNVKRRKRSKR